MAIHQNSRNRFQRALHRQEGFRQGDGKIGSRIPGGIPGAGASIPAEMANRLKKTESHKLVELLKQCDHERAQNPDLARFMVAILRERGDEQLIDGDAEELATPQEADGICPHDEFFVGWVEQAGELRFVDHRFHASNRAQVGADMLHRYQQREACGGVLGKENDKSSRMQADLRRRDATRLRGRKINSMGQINAATLSRTLASVVGRETSRFLENPEGRIMVGLFGRTIVLINEQGEIHNLNRVESWQLAQAKLFPRHWFLPIHWWHQKKATEQEEEDEKKDDSKRERKRIYYGRYDDEDEIVEEDREEYGE